MCSTSQTNAAQLPSSSVISSVICLVLVLGLSSQSRLLFLTLSLDVKPLCITFHQTSVFSEFRLQRLDALSFFTCSSDNRNAPGLQHTIGSLWSPWPLKYICGMPLAFRIVCQYQKKLAWLFFRGFPYFVSLRMSRNFLPHPVTPRNAGRLYLCTPSSSIFSS